MKLDLHQERWPLLHPFSTSRERIEAIETVRVVLTDGSARGHGEALGVDYRGETPASILDQIEAIRPAVERGLSRAALQDLLAAGGARNALDCALWDLEAKRAGRSVWALLGHEPRPLTTAYTITLSSPADMADAARQVTQFPLLKLKLGANNAVACVSAVRRVRPDARLIVDANESWSMGDLAELVAPLLDLGVQLIEQPLPAGSDAPLSDYTGSVPLCADESCASCTDLDLLAGRYHWVNIKLDKTGGLTEALRLVQAAGARGLGLMIGNMLGTSLAMAPAFVVGQFCQYVDLDGPLLQREDREDRIVYAGARMQVPPQALWG